MLISKIVSGGQTGVDRGAIEAALELGFPYGSLIPKGRLAEDGIVPEKFDKMTIAVRKDYLFRTEYNVGHSDATLVIAREMWDEKKAYQCYGVWPLGVHLSRTALTSMKLGLILDDRLRLDSD